MTSAFSEMELHRKKISAVHKTLLLFYGYPEWRDPLPPIDELISTFLSQNTNDTNRDRAFERLNKRFKTWEEVRDADERDVIEAIRIAGLANQKGPNIQAALRQITKERGGLDLEFLRELSVNDAKNWLMKLKGVGPKTASIVLQFSMNIPAFPVDTHIFRVTGRIGLRPSKLDVEKAHVYLSSITPPETFYALHLNLIRLGREICQARKPHCSECPILELCSFNEKSL